MAKQQQRGATKAKAAVEQGKEEDQQSQREQQTKVPAERGAGEPTRDRPQFQPRVDIYEKGNGLVLVADLPGVSTNGLEVTLEKRVLTVYGRVEEDRPEGYSPVYHEYDIGDFERQFTLADPASRERAENHRADCWQRAQQTLGIPRLASHPEMIRRKHRPIDPRTEQAIWFVEQEATLDTAVWNGHERHQRPVAE